MRRGGGKERGVRAGEGVKRRHASRSNQQNSGELGAANARIHGIPAPNYIWAGRLAFEMTLKGCEKLRLIPLTRLDGGSFVHSNTCNLLIHYTYLLLFISVAVQKVWEVYSAFMVGELELTAAFLSGSL